MLRPQFGRAYDENGKSASQVTYEIIGSLVGAALLAFF